jgi:uncharacterized protein Smg (DUF494 family)
MSLPAVLGIINAIANQLEDVTIERDALAELLVKAGYDRSDIENIWSDAKSDPAIRSKARLALADLRRQLEQEGIAAGRATHPEKPSKPEQPS